MEPTTAIVLLVGIACGLAGFGASQLLNTIMLKSRVEVHDSEIKSLKEERSETNRLLQTIVDQNTKAFAIRLGTEEK